MFKFIAIILISNEKFCPNIQIIRVSCKKKNLTGYASDQKKLYIYTSHYILDIVTICLIHYVQSNILLKIRAEYLQP